MFENEYVCYLYSLREALIIRVLILVEFLIALIFSVFLGTTILASLCDEELFTWSVNLL